jgi:hypothetical protein
MGNTDVKSFHLISEGSDRSELLRYIRFLEARLECDVEYVQGPGDVAPREVELDQGRRVETILGDLDGIGCRNATIEGQEEMLGRVSLRNAVLGAAFEFILRVENLPDEAFTIADEAASGRSSALDALLAEALSTGFVDGYAAAHDDASSTRVMVDGAELPGFALARSTILGPLGSGLARLRCDAPPPSPSPAVARAREALRAAAAPAVEEPEGMSP